MTALNVFPSLAGLAFPVAKSPTRRTRVQRTVSGRESLIMDQPTPLYRWTLSFKFLRTAADVRAGSALGPGVGFGEYEQLAGFFNQQNGPLIPFLFSDPTDGGVGGAGVTNQAIATGDGSTTAFQLKRTQGISLPGGGSTEPVYAPGPSVALVYLNGVPQSLSSYSVTQANLTTGGKLANTSGLLTFVAPPASGVAITATFNYYWPVRFADDNIDLDYFMYQLYSAQKIALMSVLP
jgi:uncharacterized protein (TIGR02217 family)